MKSATKTTTIMPSWANELAARYASGVAHAFVLHFNVEDYISTNTTLPAFLRAMFPSKDIFVIYDRLGFSFPTDTMRQEFVKRCGLAKDAPPAPKSSVLSALAIAPQAESALPSEPDQCIPLINQVLRESEDVAVLIRDAHLIWPSKGLDAASDDERTALLTAMRWGTDIEIGNARNVIFFTTPVLSEINDLILRARYEAIEIELPGLSDRETFANHLKGTRRMSALNQNIDPSELASGTAGLTLTQIRQIISAVAQRDEVLTQPLLQLMVEELGLDRVTSDDQIGDDITKGLLPDYDERLADIHAAIKQYANDECAWDLTPVEFARISGGLRLIDMEDIMMRAYYQGALTFDLIRERKDQIIESQYAAVLELAEPTFGFERIGELNHIKAFMRDDIMSPVRNGDLLNVPKGVLFVGPPGTGKSLIAQAAARELGFNMVILNFARIYGQYVGNTERNLERALLAIKSLAPTIVFIDELDQAVSRNSTGQSDPSSRVFKRLLEFMADPALQGRVIFMAATNRPDLLDSALMRPGRFDIRLPFFPPEENGRQEILRIELKARGIQIDSVPQMVLDATNGWTGAELAGLARKAATLCRKEGISPTAALEKAGKRLLSSTDEVDFFIKLALLAVNDLDLIPELYLPLAQSRSKWQSDLGQEVKQRDERQGRTGRSM